MSKANLEQFYILVQNSEQLQQQLGAIQDSQIFNETAARLGQENGYSFTADEVDTFLKEKTQESNAELSDRELEAVAGGKGGPCPLNTKFTACFLVSGCWGSKC
ncbi:MAG: Nif11-like leader peptide family natural product precursor [Nostoc sp.]|uniref:Nif11-like leader peptide family natural product precursor n=1 Tax=Nostoc sp. TaxID=1180 RepID=UPI002FFB51C8